MAYSKHHWSAFGTVYRLLFPAAALGESVVIYLHQGKRRERLRYDRRPVLVVLALIVMWNGRLNLRP